MSKPSLIVDRPPVEAIVYINADGNPYEVRVGRTGITEIRETEENGEFCLIPWLEVWCGEELTARFCQHKVEHILYRRTQRASAAPKSKERP